MEKTLGDLVIEDSRRADVFDSFGLDYCCGGQDTLSKAIEGAGVDAELVQAALELPPAKTEPTSQITANSVLAHDIVDTHHAYMWEEMPRLGQLVEKVYRVHGETHPELGRLAELYAEAVKELDPHMTKEERSVFPTISRLEKGQRPVLADTLEETIDQLVAEHIVVGELFREMNELTNGYSVPADACTSYRLMLTGLQEMERDLHQHIHKENNILFPEALKLN